MITNEKYGGRNASLVVLHKNINASALPSGGIVKTNLTRGAVNKLVSIKKCRGNDLLDAVA